MESEPLGLRTTKFMERTKGVEHTLNRRVCSCCRTVIRHTGK